MIDSEPGTKFFRVTVSNVANNLSASNSLEPVSLLKSVVLPAFVYPTIPTV